MVSVDISHTLPIAASSSLDAHIRLWDLENGKQIKSIDAGPGKSFTLREDIRGLRSLFDIFRERCILVFIVLQTIIKIVCYWHKNRHSPIG